MSIVATARVSDFFEEVVDEAMRTKRVTASEGARSYVVSLLTDLAKPGSPVEKTLERPLTFLLNEANQTPELADRFEKLRTLGDGVLYSSGFFAEHFEARGLDPKYIIGIGRAAYEGAGSLIGAGSQEKDSGIDIFHELAAGFVEFVALISEVANATLARGTATSRGILKLYERWLKTRSESLEAALSSHGFMPTRGGGRVLS